MKNQRLAFDMLHRRCSTRSRCRLVLLLIGLSLQLHIGSAFAEDVLDQSLFFDIPPGTYLEDALINWGRQAGVTLMINTPTVEKKRTSGIHGTFNARSALNELLKDSGLSFKQDGQRVSIVAEPDLKHPAFWGAESLPDDQTMDEHNASRTGSTSAREGTAPADDKGQLDEVIVTAQRREESLSTVPISVTALSAATLEDLHIQSFSDLATIVPGLVMPQAGSGNQSATNVALRGVISGDHASTTGIYIDETPIMVRQILAAGFSGSPQPDIFDLDRVEVLRGPQGTLFGSSAMGGVIRFITPQPNLNVASGTAKVEFGYTDRGDPSYAVGLAYGAPVIPGEVGFRVSGWFHSDGGFIDVEDPFTGQILNRNANSASSYVLRPAFTIVPTDGLTVTPAVFIQRHHSDEPSEYWVTDLPEFEKASYVSAFGAHVPQPVEDNLTVTSLAIKYDFGKVAFQSDTSYMDREYHDYDDYSNILPAFFGLQPVTPSLASFYSYDKNIVWTKAWQQEFRLSSKEDDSRVSWQGGLYLRHAVDGVSQYISPDLGPLTLLQSPPQTSLDYFGVPDYVSNDQTFDSFTYFSTVTDQRALFGEITLRILSRLKANVGVRAERSANLDQKQIFAGPLDGTIYSSSLAPDEIDHPVTPRAGLTYQYTDNDMVYFTAAKGYRAGGTNSAIAYANPLCEPSALALGLAAVPTSFKPDSLWSYEVGSKSSLFDRHLSVQGSAFYIDWSHIQTSVALNDCGEFFTDNRGTVISRGFDLQFAAALPGSLKVTGNVAYTDTYYKDAAYGGSENGNPPPLLNAAGDKVSSVLPWTAAVAVDYSRDIGALWGHSRSYLRVDYRWQDAAPVGNPAVVTYTPISPGGVTPDSAYNLVNLRVGLIHEGLDLSLFADNVTNSKPRFDYSSVTPGASLVSAVALRPLTMGFTAFFRF